MKKQLLVYILICVPILLFSQRVILDSIRKQVNLHVKEDTARAFFLNELAWQYLDYSTDSAKMYAKEALHLSEKLNYTDGIISAKNVQGLLLRINNELDAAIKLAEEVVELRLRYGPPQRLTGAYSNLGSVYIVKSDYPNAIKYLNKALENATKYNEAENQLLILSNMGIVYGYAELNDLALEAYQKAVVINKKLPAETQEYQRAQLYVNIASIYHKRGLYKEAYKYFKPSYDFYKAEDNTRQLSTVVYNLVSTTRHLRDYAASEFFLREMKRIDELLKEPQYTTEYHLSMANYLLERDRYKEALNETEQGLKIVDTVNSLQTYSVLLGIKSDCYKFLGEYEKSLVLADQAMAIVISMDNKTERATLYKSKSEVYALMKDYKSALKFYDMAVKLRDSLNTELVDTRIATLNSFNQLDRKEKELELLNTEKEKVALENKRQTTMLIAGSVVGMLILVLLVLSVRAYKVKQRDNILLNEQKIMIEEKNAVLFESKKEIQHQKELVEEKQKEIVDSINYALQIQKTLIANHDFVNRTIPDSFVFFRPKDIVSGDFYWATRKDDRFYLAVCDSTGHGVPGAFMSLLNINYLNEAIKEKGITAPNEVFDHVRSRLIETISQNGRQDGMDGILICIEDNSNVITYAAANNKPVIVMNNELLELKADKMPVGIGETQKPFTLFSFERYPGSVLYLYTDGFADQFGGPKGKKFKYKQLDDILLSAHQLPVYEQQEKLKQVFEMWKGNLDQVDDVCVLGVRF